MRLSAITRLIAAPKDGVDGADGKDGKDGVDGKDGTSITIKGTARGHFTNFTEFRSAVSSGSITVGEGELILLDSSNDYSETYDGETHSGYSAPSVMVYVNAPDYTYSVSKATEGDCYIDMEGYLWVCGSTAWTNAGLLKGIDGEDGDDGLSIVASPDNVLFTARNNAVFVAIDVYRGAEKLSYSDYTIEKITDYPSGVSCSFANTSAAKGATIRRTDTTADISGTVTIPLTIDGVSYSKIVTISTALDGSDAISINVSGETVLFGPDSGTQYVEIHAYKGSEEITITEDMLSEFKADITNLNGGYQGNNGYWFQRENEDVAVNASWDYTITIDGVAYSRKIVFRTVQNGLDGTKGSNGSDGEDGKDGADGADGISYSIVPSTSSIIYIPARSVYQPTSIKFSFYKNEGGMQSQYSCVYCLVTRTFVGGTRKTGTQSALSLETPLYSDTSYGVLEEITCELYSSTTVIDQTTLIASVTVQVATRAVMRGPQKWDLLDTGYQFYSGDAGEPYIDFVVYENNYYKCQTSHTKGETKPSEDVVNNLGNWALSEKIEMVATAMLLATYAYIDNLLVKEIYMESENSDTAIWMNPYIKGIAIVAKSLLTKYGRANQSESDSVWDNPSTLFTGDELRDIEGIYNTSYTTTEVDGEDISPMNITGDTKESYSEAVVSSISIPAGSTIVIVLEEQTISLTEGSTGTDESQLRAMRSSAQVSFDLRESGGTVIQNIIDVTLRGSGTSGDKVDKKVSSVTVSYKNTTNLAMLVGIYRSIDCVIRRGGSVSTTAFNVKRAVITDEYHSEYSGTGLRVSLSSMNYFLSAIQDSSMVFKIVANNFGLLVDKDSLRQVSEGIEAPLAYNLMIAKYWVNGSEMFQKAKTFDGKKPTFSYNGTGSYTITLPSDWADIFGSINSEKLCVTVNSYDNQANSNAYIWYMKDRQIQIVTRNSSGSLADIEFNLRVDYIGDVQTNTLTIN